MTLHICVTDERFQTIKKITEKNTNHKIKIITSGVTGLYSEWIPPFTDIDRDYIKVFNSGIQRRDSRRFRHKTI
jgi:predicted esterase YcpF (UPF0227 family)